MKNQVFVTTTIHAKFIFFSDVFSALETKIVADCSSLVFLQTKRNKVPAGSSQKSIFQQKVLRSLLVKEDMSNSLKKFLTHIQIGQYAKFNRRERLILT